MKSKRKLFVIFSPREHAAVSTMRHPIIVAVILCFSCLHAAENTGQESLQKAEKIWRDNRMRHLALPHYQKAADKGIAQAAFRLGEMHRDGLGTTIDHELARLYFRQAMAGNAPEAKLELAKLLAHQAASAEQQQEGIQPSMSWPRQTIIARSASSAAA